MISKLKVLKDLAHQMQCLMAEGEGDSKEAGEEAMSELSEKAEEGGAKLAGAVEKDLNMSGDEEDKEFKDYRKEEMKKHTKMSDGKKKPGMGMVMMKIAKLSPKKGK